MKIFTWLPAFLLLITSHWQSVSAQEIPFEHVSVEKGLSSTSVYAMTQTPDGFLWIGTQNGLNRYDGYNFRVFSYTPGDTGSLVNNWVKALLTDKAGNLWVGTSNGLCRYNSEKESFTAFLADKENKHSLAANNVWCLYEDLNGTIWIGTDNGLSAYNPRTQLFTSYQIKGKENNSFNHAINAIAESPDGSLLVGTWGSGIFRFDKNTHSFSPMVLPNSVNGGQLFVKVLRYDSAGRLWIGTQGSGVLLYQPSLHQVKQFTNNSQANSISDNDILSISEDRFGRIWIGTYGQGLCLFDTARGFIRYQTDELNPQSLHGSWITCLYEDKAGMMWVGHDNGISKFNLRGPKFRLYRNITGNPNSIPKSNINIVYEDRDGLIWFGMWGGGLTSFNPLSGQFTHYKNNPASKATLSDNRVWGICEDEQDQLWIATSSGLDILDKKTGRFIQYNALLQKRPDLQMSHHNLSYIMSDRKGRKWIGTWGEGFYLYDPTNNILKHFTHHPDQPNSPAGNRIRHIFEDSQGLIWISTSEGGLDRLVMADDGRWLFSHYQYKDGTEGSLGSNSPMVVFEDNRNRLWVGTDGSGLNLFDRRTNRFSNIEELAQNGINNVLGILEDKDGVLWLGTNHGLARYQPISGQVKVYDVSDGLQSNSFLYGHCKTRDGQMIFGGHNGFNIFTPEQIKDSHFQPRVILSDLRLFNESVQVGKLHQNALASNGPILTKPLALCSSLVLSYKDYVLSFGFAALDFTASHKNRYAYMLENFDDKWNYTDAEKRYATYTNLKPGEYVFKVKGTNSDGVWSNHVASLKVIVTPPFWETWWFRLVVTVIVLLAALLIHRIWLQLKFDNLLAMERVKAQEAESIRKRVAMDFHDEMGNQLASMTALINLINLRRSKNDNNFDDLLIKLNQNAQNLFYGTRDFIWSIDPKSDKAEEVLLNIKDFAEDLFFGSGVSFYFENQLQQHNVVFPPGTSRHITLISKEIFTNCLKHADCTHVWLICQYENEVFSMTIKDDGKGFDNISLRRDGNGLKNISTRAQKIGASLLVDSVLHKGTTITVALPIPKKGEK